jgi:hypothetical protein
MAGMHFDLFSVSVSVTSRLSFLACRVSSLRKNQTQTQTRHVTLTNTYTDNWTFILTLYKKGTYDKICG